MNSHYLLLLGILLSWLSMHQALGPCTYPTRSARRVVDAFCDSVFDISEDVYPDLSNVPPRPVGGRD